MSCLITRTCNGYTVTLQVDILSVRPASEAAESVSPAVCGLSASLPDTPAFLSAEKGGEKESEKKAAQRKEKEKDPERESSASQLSRIAEAWNSLPLKKIARFTGKRKERTELLLSRYPADEIISTIYSVARSRFLLGGGANHWQIRFDWFILPENFEKVRNGNYLDEEEEETDGQQNRLGYCGRELQDINRVWNDSSDTAAGDNV